MAISFVNAGAEGSAGSGNITLGAPASPQTDDIWIAIVHSSDQVSHSFTDWTQIAQGNGGGTTSRISVWYFRYAGSTPNLVVTHSNGQSPIGGIAAFRGCKATGSPVDTTGSISGGTDDTIEHSAITPSQDNCMIVACNGSADDNNRSTPPSGYSVRFEDSGGGTQNCYQTAAGTPDGSVACHTLLQTSAADTGTVTDTQAASDPWASVLIALAPLADTILTPSAPAFSLSAPNPTVDLGTLTLTPSVPACSSSAPSVTFDMGTATLTPDAASTAISAPDPTIVQELVFTPDSTAISASAPDPSVAFGTATMTPSAAAFVMASPDASIDLGTLTLTPGVAVASLTPPDVTVEMLLTIAPSETAFTIGAVAPVIDFGTAILSPDAAQLSGSVPGVTVDTGTLTILPNAPIFTLGAPDPVVDVGGGTQTLTPNPVTFQLSSPSAAVDLGTLTLLPSAGQATLSAAEVTLAFGTATMSPDPAQMTTSAPDVSVVSGLVLTPSIAALILLAADSTIDLGTKTIITDAAPLILSVAIPTIAQSGDPGFVAELPRLYVLRNAIYQVAKKAMGTPHTFRIDFDGDFTAGDEINASFDGEAIAPVTFAESHAATLAKLALEIQRTGAIFKATVTGARQITCTGSETGNEVGVVGPTVT